MIYSKKLQEIYSKLLNLYGHQGWWPLIDVVDINGVNPTKTGSLSGYHPKDYSYPKTQNQRFEIICGAILTQNTNWINVEKSLLSLKPITNFEAKKILELDDEILKSAIKSSGYFNQKAKKLKIIAEFFIGLDGEIPTRQELLEVYGVGPETADSIRLYAYNQPEFIVDSYTRKVFSNFGLITGTERYADIKNLFEENLEKDYKLYQEYHALIVENAKRLK